MDEKDRRFTVHWDAVDPFDPDYPHLWIKVEHLGRYLFAANYLASRNIRTAVDIGCGAGYGSLELARVVDTVSALDSDPTVLMKARRDRQCDRISYIQCNFGRDPLQRIVSGRLFDAIVCFETLEHLTDPGRAIEEFNSILNNDGILIASVPNGVAERVDRAGLLTNSLHRRIFSISGFSEMVEANGFEVMEVLGQPVAGEINRNETRLIRRRQTSGRIGDDPSFHSAENIRRLALATAYPEQRDVERSYSIILVARRNSDPS